MFHLMIVSTYCWASRRHLACKKNPTAAMLRSFRRKIGQQSKIRVPVTARRSLWLVWFLLQLPNDISYVFSGYAPLSVRLAHILHRPGWRSISEVLSLLPGPTTEEAQPVHGWQRKRRRYTSTC